MTDTAKLGLPLIAPSQAQKHVTVNEALSRLDAAVQLTVVSRLLAAPPAVSQEGDCHIVGFGGANDWAGQDGKVAVRQNGGWVFLSPRAGWTAFVTEESAILRHDGAGWVEGAVAISPGGAALAFGVVEFDHAVSAGPTSTTIPAIAPGSLVFGVTGRVVAAVSGTLASWRLGVPGADDRYGSGLGVAAGSWVRGLTGSPLAYYAPSELLLTAEGGDFAGGTVRFAIHVATLGLPRPV